MKRNHLAPVAVLGPMNGGKSAKAQVLSLERPELYRPIDPWSVIFFKPEFDNRTDGFFSRVGNVKRDAIVLPGDPDEVVRELQEFEGTNHVLLVDEGHFLGIRKTRVDLRPEELRHMHEALVRLAASGCPLFIAALESDYARRIPPVVELLLLDPRVRKQFVRAICSICGKRAQLTQRLTNGKPSSRSEPMFVVQSANDVAGDRHEDAPSPHTYEPRCLRCHELAD